MLATLGELYDQVHHRLLRGDVEAGGRLIRDQKLRIAGQRQRDHDTLAHAAGKFERIGVIALARARDLDLLQRLDRLFAAVADLRLLHMLAQHVLDLVADFRIGFSAARGFWKIIEISRPRRSRISFSLAALTSMPENTTEPSAILPARSRIRITAYDVTDLPEPNFADDAERLAFGDGDVDVLHRLHDAAPGGEFDRRSLTSSRGLGGRDALGKNIENNPMQSRTVSTAVAFPRPITSSAADRRCRAGRHRAVEATPRSWRRPRNSAIHIRRTMKPAPSTTMMPRSTVGGHTPSPMNDKTGDVENRVAHGQRHLLDHDQHDVGEVCPSRIRNSPCPTAAPPARNRRCGAHWLRPAPRAHRVESSRSQSR